MIYPIINQPPLATMYYEHTEPLEFGVIHTINDVQWIVEGYTVKIEGRAIFCHKLIEYKPHTITTAN